MFQLSDGETAERGVCVCVYVPTCDVCACGVWRVCGREDVRDAHRHRPPQRGSALASELGLHRTRNERRKAHEGQCGRRPAADAMAVGGH